MQTTLFTQSMYTGAQASKKGALKNGLFAQIRKEGDVTISLT